MDKKSDYGINETIARDFGDFLQRLGDGSNIFFFEPLLHSTLKMLGIFKGIFETREDNIGCFKLREEVDFLPADKVVYILRADTDCTRSLIVHLLSYKQLFSGATPHIYFVPQKTLLMEQLLREELKIESSFPTVKIDSLDIDIFGLEKKVLSLQLVSSFRQISVRNDLSPLTWIARALLKLETVKYGQYSSVFGKGDKAAKVVRMLKSMEAEMNSDFLLGNSSHEKNDLLIFDRTSDLVTPLLTQLTYEGLIDETYTIESSTASFPFSLGESVASGDSIVLDNFDKVFNELRDQNITSVGSTLYQKSIWIKQSYEKRKEVQHLKELKEFLKTLPEMQEYHRLISIHTNIATELGYLIQSVDFGERIQMEHNIIQQNNNKEVFEYIENLIFRKPDISSVLRLMCLHSVVNGGLRTKDYERLKESLMLTYGIPHVISTFFELEKCGLLRVEGKQTMNYSAVRKQFQTWVTNLDERKPNDIAYTYSGYAPPIVRFVEKYAKNANIMAGENDLLNLLPGPREEMINPSHTIEKAKRNIFVCIIGGITSAEISALRFVESQCQSPVEITVVATELLTGKRLVNSLVPFA